MKKLKILIKYFHYLLKANNRHGIHSPFVYDLIDNVIYDTKVYPEYLEIEKIRKKYIADTGSIQIEDYGAGSSINSARTRKISEIAAYSAKSKKQAALLFRLVKYFKSSTILELGTSLGITTLYLAKAGENSKVFSIEGCPNTAALAKNGFENCSVQNITLTTGEFQNVLPGLIVGLPELDFVFFDGNHQKEPTLAYFEACLQKAGNNAVFVFDDIHWSDEMDQA
nr:class I SAM-dependent methyltransferase [Bacteroidota bacterium]